MAPGKKPFTPPIPIKVHILSLADRHAHPHASVAPTHAFTLRLVPDTTLREVCTHAGGFLSLQFHKFVDSSRLEARDGNGYVFEGKETIGQELGEGGDVYLIEEAIEVEQARKEMLRTLDVPKGKGIRTPKAKKDKEPRKTPSQRNLEIAQQGGRMARMEVGQSPLRDLHSGRVARSEPKPRTISTASLKSGYRARSHSPMQLLPGPQDGHDASEPLVESIEDSPPSTTAEKKVLSASQLARNGKTSDQSVGTIGGSPPPAKSASRYNSSPWVAKEEDASAILLQSIEAAPSTTKQTKRRGFTSQQATGPDADASVPAVAPSDLPLSNSTALLPPQDDRVIPDSQDLESQSINTPSQNNPMAHSWTAINTPRRPVEVQPRSATQTPANKAHSVVDAPSEVKQTWAKPLLHKPDQYDISAVLSDDEYYSPRQRSLFMSSSIHKLGSAAKCPAFASAPVPRKSLLTAKQSSAAGNKPPLRTKATATSHDKDTVPSTPLSRAPLTTPAQAGLSSVPGPLLSSPTNHVAAALARGRAKVHHQPHPEVIEIEDSDPEVVADVLVDAQNQLSSSRQKSQSLEASLPWSAPPLRMGGEDPFWTLRTTGRRTSMGGQRNMDEDVDAEAAERKKTVDVKQQIPMPVLSSDVMEAQMLPTSGIPPFKLGSPVKSAEKRVSQSFARRSPAKSPLKLSPQVATGKSPLLLVHGSSSSEEGVEEIGYIDDTPPNSEAPSPSKAVETVIGHGSGSQHEARSGSKAHDFMAKSPLARALFGNDKSPSSRPAPLEDYLLREDESFKVARVPETDPESEYVIEDTPPSAQPSKRKRGISDEHDPEEERKMQKKARHEARVAKKAERKRLREEKMAQEEEQRKLDQTRLQEERKRVAMENAYRRALELEMVVSSPTKATEMGLGMSDAHGSDQESELGSSPPIHAALLPVSEGSDDSLESTETDKNPSWRKLSKRHFSASPSSSQEGAAAHGIIGAASPNNMNVAASDHADAVLAAPRAEFPQDADAATETTGPSQRKALAEWAFFETTLGTSAYSPLQIHNRIHMQTVQANLQRKPWEAGQENKNAGPKERVKNDATGQELSKQPDRFAKCKDAMSCSPSEDPQAQEAAEDKNEVSRRTTRSAAPSPKDLTAAPVQAVEENSGNKKHNRDHKKSQQRKGKDNKRKKRWRQKDTPGLSKAFKRKHAFGGKGPKQ